MLRALHTSSKAMDIAVMSFGFKNGVSQVGQDLCHSLHSPEYIELCPSRRLRQSFHLCRDAITIFKTTILSIPRFNSGTGEADAVSL
jgi:hypothetical protein